MSAAKPIVLITGATGNLGRSVAAELERDYKVVGLDRTAKEFGFPVLEADFAQDAGVELALARFREQFGPRIASVIHLVAYFDFTGEENPLYEDITVKGTQRLLRALRPFEVEQFVYADGRYLGPLTLEQAFARSSNVAAARVFRAVGAPAVVRTARDLGITSPLSPVPSLALGTSEVSLLELTSAYAAVAGGAYPVRPAAAPGTTGQRGEHRLDWRSEQEPLLRLLQAAASGGPAGDLPIATYGKTGTSQGGRDALFVGFAGDLVIGVWAGNDDGTPMLGHSGGRLPALIWRDVMEFAMANEIAAVEHSWERPTSPWKAPRPAERLRGWPDRLLELFGV